MRIVREGVLDYELEQTRKRKAEEWWESDELSHLVEETIDDVINGCNLLLEL